ncbi:MAG: hypothetical protein ATN36_07230 [Epulopiscium sp. Nele67-Bin005]|nr:MAG: hypothetical protein ATN36_07230 [Epulopiscium sp. Nele67-Bin005]
MEIIRLEEKSDQTEIREIHLSAFENDIQANLVDRVRRTSFYTPELSLVARYKQELVGHILFSRVVIKGEKSTTTGVILLPCSVKKEYQGLGIGKRLVEDGIHQAKRFGYRLIIALGSYNYYSQFGFRPATQMNLVSSTPVADSTFMAYVIDDTKFEGTVYYPREFDFY